MKISNKYLLLFLIFAAGFVIRLYYALYSKVEADEAYYLYDAYLFLKGETPFIDYTTRAPFLLVVLSGFIKIFGSSILVGRSLSLISSIITLLLAYKIGYKLYGSQVGVLAAFIFAFSPFIIWWGRPVITEPIQLMFITAAMYMLILGIESDKNKYYVLNGIFLIFAILIRESAAIFLLTEAILLIMISKLESAHIASIQVALKKYFIIIIGFILPVLPILIYLSKKQFFFRTLSQYNPVQLSLQLLQSTYTIKYIDTIATLGNLGFYILLPTFLFIAIALKGFISEKYRFSYHIYAAWVGLIGLGILMKNLLSDELIELFLIKLIIIPVLLLLLSLEPYISKKLSKTFGFYYNIIIYIIGMLYFLIVFEDLMLNKDNNEFILVFIYISLFSLSIILLKHDFNIIQRMNFSNLFLLIWFFSIFIFYFMYNRWETAYFYEYATVTSIMSSVVLYSLYKNVPRQVTPFVIVFMILLIISALSSPYVNDLNYKEPSEKPGNAQPMSVVTEVAEYIAQNTAKDDEIFTAWPIYAFQADRRVIFDIVRSYTYGDDSAMSSRGYPTLNQITTYLKENRIKYIIIDPVYMNLYIFRKNSDLKNFIYSNYQLEKKIGTVEIFAYNANMTDDKSDGFNINAYTDDFSTDRWEDDSYSHYGIDRGTTFGISGNETALYPVLKDESTYIRYKINIITPTNYVILNLTGDKRESVHSLTVWASRDNTTYSKIIDFNDVGKTTKQADITNYIKDNQTWIEFRFFRNSSGSNMPRIFDFAITTDLENNTIRVIPYKEVLSYNLTNLLIEPSFEHYKDTDKLPIAWSFTSNNGGITQIDSTGFDGNYSYRVNVNNATNGTADMSQTVDIKGSMHYSFSIAYKQSGSGNATVILQWFDENWEESGEDKLDLIAKSTWNISSIEQLTPANTQHGRIILQYVTNRGDSGTVWFDDVKLLMAPEDSS